GGLALGLAFGVGSAIDNGGTALINFWFLRRTLSKANYLPYELDAFLETMARVILLQRKGGGYRFIHLTLRDHVAQLDPQTFRLD
ncbi:MAG: hypothetical protein KC449_26215, partial [Anaerolineales bacterium]|nr:hypothetical protein [Anaerolineales bacterium]